MSHSPKHIWITGASSGIGAALAEHYAADGITLYLTGRNVERLKEVEQICVQKGATVHAQTLDVTS
ncbi:MAG: SDR family NAD(P)-dependent oxidoreductase, partial [Pseudomonadota bacterium]